MEFAEREGIVLHLLIHHWWGLEGSCWILLQRRRLDVLGAGWELVSPG